MFSCGLKAYAFGRQAAPRRRSCGARNPLLFVRAFARVTLIARTAARGVRSEAPPGLRVSARDEPHSREVE